MKLLNTGGWASEIQLSDLQNAIVTTAAVVIGLVTAIDARMNLLTGFFVVTIQNVAGLNVKDSAAGRIRLCIISSLILSGTALLVQYTKHSMPMALLSLALLCLSLAYWHQLFPDFWPSVNIPAVVIFFMAMGLPDTSPFLPVCAGVLIGIVIQVLVVVLAVVLNGNASKKFPAEDRVHGEQAMARLSHNAIHLQPGSIIYGLQLLILLSIALVVMHVSGYPHAYWMAFTMVIVLKITHEDTKKFTLERILGTVIGCFLGSVLLFFQPAGAIYIVLIGMSVFLFSLLIHKHYVAGVVCITIFVMLLIGHRSSGPVKIAMERIAFTMAGGILTYASSLAASRALHARAV